MKNGFFTEISCENLGEITVRFIFVAHADKETYKAYEETLLLRKVCSVLCVTINDCSLPMEGFFIAWNFIN